MIKFFQVLSNKPASFDLNSYPDPYLYPNPNSDTDPDSDPDRRLRCPKMEPNSRSMLSAISIRVRVRG